MSNENRDVFQTTNMLRKKQLMEDEIVAGIEELVLSRHDDPVKRSEAQAKLNHGTSSFSKRQMLVHLLERDGNQTSKDQKILVQIARLMKTFEWGEKSFDISKDHLGYLVEHIREYVRVGEVEKKEHGEVMTPLWLVEQMLDKLPEHVWSDPSLKWLDPCNGCGVFPSIVVSRLMEGLEEPIPDQRERYRHIVEKMIHVCDIQAKNCFLHMAAFDPKDLFDMNVYCGSFLDEGFDQVAREVWGVEKFDVIIGNPPYQQMKGSHSMAAKSIYHLFCEKSFDISEKTLMVTPSRWFNGSPGLSEFKKEMQTSKKVSIINTFDENKFIFGKEVDIKGGVCYFLYDHKYQGLCCLNGTMVKLDKYDIVLRDYSFSSIIDKILLHAPLSDICNSKSYYKILNNNKNLTEKKVSNTDLLVYLAKMKGGKKFIDRSLISSECVYDSYKVMTAKAAHGGYSGVAKCFIAAPDEICTETYMHFQVGSLKQARGLKRVLETKTLNVLVSLRKNTHNLKPDVFRWFPSLDLNLEWDDEKLYNFLKLTEKEISLIEEVAANIKGAHK